MQPDFWAEDFQLRFGYSETVARPDLREISDATYIDPLTEARVQGNPELDDSNLTNYDLRAEWFFASGDNLTVSLFYKDIERRSRRSRRPARTTTSCCRSSMRRRRRSTASSSRA